FSPNFFRYSSRQLFAILSFASNSVRSALLRSAANPSRCFERPAPHRHGSPQGSKPEDTMACPLFPIPSDCSSCAALASVFDLSGSPFLDQALPVFMGAVPFLVCKISVKLTLFHATFGSERWLQAIVRFPGSVFAGVVVAYLL